MNDDQPGDGRAYLTQIPFAQETIAPEGSGAG